MRKLYLNIAVKGPFYSYWTYFAQEKYRDCFFPGQVIRVPLKNSKVKGYIHSISYEYYDTHELREIIDIENIQNTIDNDILQLINFIRKYYHAPLGTVYSYAVSNNEKIKSINIIETDLDPELLNDDEICIIDYLREKKQVSNTALRRKFKNYSKLNLMLSYLKLKNYIDIVFENRGLANNERDHYDIQLNDSQNEIYKKIYEEIDRGFSTHLIYGITGSGKTYIYLKLIADMIKKEKQTLLLVPEIGLSMQLKRRFQEFIPSTAMLASSISKKDRRSILEGIRQGRHKLILGPRSSVFVPFNDLGLIIIDEEHDRSYKQDNPPCYNARDIGIYRAKIKNIPIVLGSGTPSLESYYNAKFKHKYKYYELLFRYGGSCLPEIHIVDLKKEKEENRSTKLSRLLLENLKKMQEEGDQGILFINRRGFYSSIICLKCGDSIRCGRCSVSMAYHSNADRLVCHQCGYSRLMVDSCPYCGNKKQTHFGFGTEQIEELLKEYMPDIRVIRFDSDNIKQGNKDFLLEEFAKHKYDIIIGTQMITKGFDFPKVNLVGVIQADENLYIPDFRGAERTYQIISQVSGRSGRRKKKGIVILQTYMPDHYSIVHSLKNDYEGFAEKELKLRKRFGYPPFKRQCLISSIGYNKKKVLNQIKVLYDRLHKYRGDLTIIGPVSAFIEKRKNEYRWNILIQGDLHNINSALSSIYQIYIENISGIAIDMDPNTF